jgi:16S rRNA (adenine1518-N6/adenine1519-N6)-dimethyltransferase
MIAAYMNPANEKISELLRHYGLHPEKGLGQNFLVDEVALQRVVEAAQLQPEAAVLEIGPGLGSLTRSLAMCCRRVVAVELDAALIPVLHEILSAYPNVRIVQGDILALDPDDLMCEDGRAAKYCVVANIPYYITSALIRHLLEARYPPDTLTLTVQREVAERICASPGDMSLLALSVQVYGRPQVAARIPAGAFYPPPKVDSAVIRVALFDQPRIPRAQLPAFFRLAKAGFSQKRKTLRNALAGGMAWEPRQSEALLRQASLDPQRRAETLGLEEWAALTQAYLASG